MKIAIALVLLNVVTCSYGASGPEGEYLCAGCHGYLTIKPNAGNTYKVRLGVGGGSCGGEVFAQGDAVQTLRNKFILTWKRKGQLCKTAIAVDGNRAFVSDSCIKPEDEESSACAVLGDYAKRATTTR